MQQLRQVLSALRMVSVVESVNIPFVAQFVVDGAMQPNEVMQAASSAVLDELTRFAPVMRAVREQRRAG